MEVRRATADDGPAILGVLERSLASDPFVGWLVQTGLRRNIERRRYFRVMLNTLALPRGRVDVAVVGGRIASAALWAPPETWKLGLGTSVKVMLGMVAIVGLRRFDRVNESLEAIERARPPEPRWLLTLLGTDPVHQRRGLASAVLAPVLAECDAAGMRAVLETSEESNLPFYRRHGFEVVAKTPLCDGGPACYTMVREPRA